MVPLFHKETAVPLALMSTAYSETGRTGQKRRTEAALIQAARQMVAEGQAPDVAAVAERADVSRTTAYRYFANQGELLAAAHPETATVSLLPANAPTDPSARLGIVIERFVQLILNTEAQQRTMLRLSLNTTEQDRSRLPLRQGRAIAWIGEALAPLRERLDDQTVDKLVLAIRSATGIEALTWLIDVARLSRQDAAATQRWIADALLHATTTGKPPPEAAGPTPHVRELNTDAIQE